MGNPEETTNDTEVVTKRMEKPPIDPELARQRTEAMDAALDITATTTKLKAKEALKAAEEDLSKQREELDYAESAFREAVYEAGCKLAHKQPVTAAVQQLGKLLAGVDLTPEEVYADVRTYSEGHSSLVISDADEDEAAAPTKIVVDAYPIVEIDFRRSTEGQTTHYEGDKVSTIMDISNDSMLMGMWTTWKEQSDAHDAAFDARQEAQERLDNIPDQVDVARVQLQRGKLENMGEEGRRVLGHVTEMLEASEGNNYLEML